MKLLTVLLINLLIILLIILLISYHFREIIPTTLRADLLHLKLPIRDHHSPALKLYTGRMTFMISAVGPMFATMSSIDLYAIGDSSSVPFETQVV